MNIMMISNREGMGLVGKWRNWELIDSVVRNRWPRLPPNFLLWLLAVQLVTNADSSKRQDSVAERPKFYKKLTGCTIRLWLAVWCLLFTHFPACGLHTGIKSHIIGNLSPQIENAANIMLQKSCSRWVCREWLPSNRVWQLQGSVTGTPAALTQLQSHPTLCLEYVECFSACSYVTCCSLTSSQREVRPWNDLVSLLAVILLCSVIPLLISPLCSTLAIIGYCRW